MQALQREVVAANTGRALVVRQGQLVRVAGRTTADFVAFNLHDVRERFDQARTKTNQNTIYVRAGHVLYSKSNHVMLTIVEDTAQVTMRAETDLVVAVSACPDLAVEGGDLLLEILDDDTALVGAAGREGNTA